MKCPCASDLVYEACCGIYHSGEKAPTAEALMRARYSAYVLGMEAYLLLSWHASTKPATLDLDAEPRPKWLGLEVKKSGESSVEFVARYKIGGRAYRLHETSRFVREDGNWLYVDGLF